MTRMSVKPSIPDRVDEQLRLVLACLGLDENSIESIGYTAPVTFLPEVNCCHLNVGLQMKDCGGSAQLGWILAQDPAVPFAEATLHTVWMSPDRVLVDVTPREDGAELVWFIPDPVRTIQFTESRGLPAIRAYNNVRVLHQHVLSKPEPILLVLYDDFAQRHGLFPW